METVILGILGILMFLYLVSLLGAALAQLQRLENKMNLIMIRYPPKRDDHSDFTLL